MNGPKDRKTVDIFTRRPVQAEEPDGREQGEGDQGGSAGKGREADCSRLEERGFGYTVSVTAKGEKTLMISVPEDLYREFDSIIIFQKREITPKAK